MLTTCTICGLTLAVPEEREDSALCTGCLLANFGGEGMPEIPRAEERRTRRRETALFQLQVRRQAEADHV